MENYIVSARKYRPSTFETVVGQKSLTQTLKNAIANNKLAHAYLFSGPRGVGKTTCARIFAKTINCLNPTANGEPCNECESCKAFNEQRSYNIHELDAASNNSVDDIRELISQVQVPPQIGKYKVFIIDEVHMLSTSAFNAFLKTLEEPPLHAIFILATTEKHKLLPTILSRCQIYDFNRITVKDTVDHLAYVASKENISFEPQALNVIAQKADGGMRDALSIFDQVVSFTNGAVTYHGVIDNLNILDYEYYFRITEAFLEGNVSKALLILNDIILKGFDPQHFINGLSSHLREVMVSKDPSTISLLEVAGDIASKYSDTAKKCDVRFLYKALEISNECDMNYRTSKNKRLLVEIALIKICKLMMPKDSFSDNGQENSLKNISAQSNGSSGVSAQGAGASQNGASYSHNQNQNQNPQNNASSGYQNGNVVVKNNVKEQPETSSNAKDGVKQNNESNQSQIHNIVVPPAPSPAKIASTRNVGGIKSISIKKGIKKEESIEVDNSHHLDQMNATVSEERLVEKWVDFTKSIPKEVILVNTMLSCHPTLTSATSFDVIVENPEQVSRINEKGSDILYFLRKNLSNSNLTMNLHVSDKKTSKKVYSQKEKYEFMVNRNPDILFLKEKFNLELS
ncbi:MAG: DNA polymerase III subunit gamma/tau [Bacteroidales bacterium]|nr:DNA polymerase III subunit gamma/tau [Bacteroidales bacterium]